METSKKLRIIYFLIFSSMMIILYSVYVNDLVSLSVNNMTYSHVLLIPLISGFFVFAERKKIFRNIQYDIKAGTTIIIAGITMYLLGRIFNFTLTQNDFLSLIAFSFVLCLIGGFILFYGVSIAYIIFWK